MSRVGKSGKKRNKSRSTSGSKVGCFIALLVLLLVALLLYMYDRQEKLSSAKPTTETEQTSTPTSHPTSEQVSATAGKNASGSAGSSGSSESRFDQAAGTSSGGTSQSASSGGTSQSASSKGTSKSTSAEAFTGYEGLDIARSLTSRTEQLIQHIGYTVSYNRILRLPNWVSYELTRQETRGKEKRGDRFLPDPLAKGSTAANSDYTRSGYDKGHMAPAADMKWAADVMKESFYFTNICPQHPELNRRSWKMLEDQIRDWSVTDSAIIIVCGPIMDTHPRKLGKNEVAIPRKFFKVILSPYIATPKAIGFLFDNARSVEPLCAYVVTVDSIERLTGLDFFAPLPDGIENKIEATADCSQWGL